jgi:hypothetical protein
MNVAGSTKFWSRSIPISSTAPSIGSGNGALLLIQGHGLQIVLCDRDTIEIESDCRRCAISSTAFVVGESVRRSLPSTNGSNVSLTIRVRLLGQLMVVEGKLT